MRYTPETYAHAFLAALHETPRSRRSQLTRRLIGAVARRGDRRLLPKIFNIIEQTLIRAAGGRVIQLEFARAVPARLLAGLAARFSRKDRISIIENPALIAGVRVTVDGERELDQTLARKLRGMFS